MWGMVRIKFPVNQGKHPHTPASLFTAVRNEKDWWEKLLVQTHLTYHTAWVATMIPQWGKVVPFPQSAL